MNRSSLIALAQRHRRLLWVIGAIAILGVILKLSLFAVRFPCEKLTRQPVVSTRIFDANEQLLRQEMSTGGMRESWTSLEQISPYLKQATLASEDHRFYAHSGIDWSAVLRAAWLNVKSGGAAFGASTITMQLTRIVAGTNRSLGGKIKQMVLALRLEQLRDKDAILEQYLNRAYYGNGAWGVAQAAQLYFGKSADALSISEAAFLTVLPRGPSNYDPYTHLDRALKRRDQILTLMEKRGYINSDARALAMRAPLHIAQNRPPFLAPHFAQYAKSQLPQRYQTGATVHTTLDLTLQQQMEQLVTDHVRRLRHRNFTQAAMVVLRNSDGAILAMVGSADYSDHKNRGAFNGALARLRPGSTLKPFVYASAMERGDTPATIAYDVVLPADAHQFYTKDVRSHGFARYRESLAGSYNLSAVHTLQRVGIQTVLNKLRDAGIWTLDKDDDSYDWGLAIGHAEVRLLELTAAFSTFGRGGTPVAPYSVSSAKDVHNSSWHEPKQSRSPIFSEEIAYLIFDILSDPDARRPMFGDSVPMNLPFKVALKTGTTKAFTDLWALGTTKEFTVGIWGGNFNGEPTHQVRSVQGATPLMRAAYTAIAARYGYPTAPLKPKGIVSSPICPVSGKRPGPHCHHVKEELFVKDNIPSAACDWHVERCGHTVTQYPPVLQGWAKEISRTDELDCDQPANDGTLEIVAPDPGAQYILEPHRPAQLQRPPLRAMPYNQPINWTIDGTPADQWTPHPGTFTVTAHYQGQTDSVTISYQ